MNKKYMLASAVLATTFAAWAGNDVPGNCGVGSGSGNASCGGSTNNTNGNVNTNKNSSRSSSKSSATALSASASTSSAKATGGGGGSAQATGGTGGSASSTGGQGVGTVNVTNDRDDRVPAASAWAAPVHPTANCAMGTSVGVQGGVGFSVSGTHTDETCTTIEQAKAVLSVMGDKGVAAEVLCSLPKVREARLRTGQPCYQDTQAGKAKVANEPTDPFVRRRLGLPPL